MADAKDDAGAFDGFGHGPTIRQRGGHRLLAEHVVPPLRKRLDDLEVERVLDGDDDAVGQLASRRVVAGRQEVLVVRERPRVRVERAEVGPRLGTGLGDGYYTGQLRV